MCLKYMALIHFMRLWAFKNAENFCTSSMKFELKMCIKYLSVPMCNIYGKPVPGAAVHYQFCCSFPKNAQTLLALES